METIKKILFTSAITIKWLRSQLKLSFRKGSKIPIHICFCLVDHYEPGTGNVSKEIEIDRVNELVENYPIIVKNHKDNNGNIPKRTWFFPPHYHRNNNLKKLVRNHQAR